MKDFHKLLLKSARSGLWISILFLLGACQVPKTQPSVEPTASMTVADTTLWAKESRLNGDRYYKKFVFSQGNNLQIYTYFLPASDPTVTYYIYSDGDYWYEDNILIHENMAYHFVRTETGAKIDGIDFNDWLVLVEPVDILTDPAFSNIIFDQFREYL